MLLSKVLPIAYSALNQIAPHCHRAQIAGSIRRRKAEVKDIEIVVIPKPFEHGLFESGLALVVNQWEKVKGEMIYGKVRYTQRILPQGIKLDLFFATPENWGNIFAIRTGPAEYSANVLAAGWVARGYHSVDGMLRYNGHTVPLPEEEDLFKLLGMPFMPPDMRGV